MSDELKVDKELIDKITLLKEEDKNKEALEMVIEAQKAYPKDASLWFLRARALNGLDRPEESIVACDKAIENGHDNPAYVYRYKGSILEEQESWEKALKEYESSLSIDSTSVDGLLGKARLLFTIKGNDAPILPIANRIVKLDPKNKGGWNMKAMGHHMLNENKEAEDAVNKALEIDPNFVGALVTKASIVEMIPSRRSEAQKLMKRAEELEPNNEVVLGVKNEMAKGKMEREYAKSPNMPTTPEEAKRTLMKCYACTIGIGGFYTMFVLTEPVLILTIPLIFFAAFSLYWGWGDVWPKWKNLFGGFGFVSNSGLIGLIIIVLFIEIPALIAVFYGAFVGIGRYKKVKAIADRKQ